MASGKSNYLAQAILNWLYRGISFTPPATVYIALSTQAWDPSLDGTGILEPDSGSGYARVAIASAAVNWSAPSGAPPMIANTADAVFPTASGSWGSIMSVYLLDSATVGAGNCLHGGDVGAVQVNVGATAAFAAGQLQVSES